MQVVANAVVVILILQYINVSHQHVVHLTLLDANYIPIKLGVGRQDYDLSE